MIRRSRHHLLCGQETHCGSGVWSAQNRGLRATATAKVVGGSTDHVAQQACFSYPCIPGRGSPQGRISERSITSTSSGQGTPTVDTLHLQKLALCNSAGLEEARASSCRPSNTTLRVWPEALHASHSSSATHRMGRSRLRSCLTVVLSNRPVPR
ncbi:hypothetical protein LIA77_08590 [Sarocladium implicatum]|nr:hypothetical protein LIA77_08590 [Sarocladium implicatum]